MDKRDKLYELHRIFAQSRTSYISKTTLLERLEISESTLKRRLRDLRDQYGAPLEYSSEHHGWYYRPGEHFELPGLWFNQQELYAFLTLEQLLETLGPGLVSTQLAQARNRIKTLLSAHSNLDEDINEKLRIIATFQRKIDSSYFQELVKATFSRRQLKITTTNRQTRHITERTISPQRIVYYKDNWYIDAYCHYRNAIRTFAMDSIQKVTQLHRAAKMISPEKIDAETQQSYGIFSGKATHTAVIEFHPPASFWVANEIWHPQQSGQWRTAEIYELHIPYHHEKELLADILRYGDLVTVRAPQTLRDAIRHTAQTILNRHQ